MTFFALMFWLVMAGYIFGKRTGKEWLWAGIAIPASFVLYFLTLLAAAH